MRKIIRQVLDWSEPRFKRITMSHDASGNPAELVGADGTICYRKEGGSCVELGGGESLWEEQDIGLAEAIAAVVNRPVILNDIWMKNAGAGVDSDITILMVLGGGGGGHPYETVEV